MNGTPQPSNEAQRLTALRRYQVLDTQPEESFDAIVRLTAQICKTPISLITLVDEARQWFKARVGLDLTQTPRDIAFCAHAITGEKLCLVPDALADERFRNNPLVLGEPRIRFYAGMPLITADGCAVGTLCVIDQKPRHDLTEHERQSLQLLARETITQLELRRASMELSETKRALQDINVELEAFGSAVAHDLRAPVRHIIGFAKLLAEEFPDNATARQHIVRIDQACAKMRDIIDALLRLARVSHADLNRQAIDLSALAHELTAELRAAEPNRKFKFIIAPAIKATGDGAFIRIALLNLLSNAAKFTRERPEARIEFGALGEGKRREYFVSDNGVGFDPAMSLVPSRPFVRLRAGTLYEGIGLGLTIVERIIRRHNGTLRAEGHVDGGATFAFTLGEQDGIGTNPEFCG